MFYHTLILFIAMKICNKQGCQNEIPLTTEIDGRSVNLQRRKFCLSCSPFKSHNTRNLNSTTKTSYEHVKNFRKRMKQKAVDYKGGACQICGYTRCNEALTFHHRDPSEKDFTIGYEKAWGFDRIKPELDKCVLLCNRCHAEVHQGLVPLPN